MLAGKKVVHLKRGGKQGNETRRRNGALGKVFLIQVVVNVNLLKITSHFLNIIISFFQIKLFVR